MRIIEFVSVQFIYLIVAVLPIDDPAASLQLFLQPLLVEGPVAELQVLGVGAGH